MEYKFLRQIIHFYKHGAARRGIKYELSKNFVEKASNSNCSYCNHPPSQEFTIKGVTILRTGIDRKDNNIGYIESNCIPCCKWCNLRKGSLSVSEFLKRIHNVEKIH